jgi:hypothetical protein
MSFSYLVLLKLGLGARGYLFVSLCYSREILPQINLPFHLTLSQPTQYHPIHLQCNRSNITLIDLLVVLTRRLFRLKWSALICFTPSGRGLQWSAAYTHGSADGAVTGWTGWGYSCYRRVRMVDGLTGTDPRHWFLQFGYNSSAGALLLYPIS